MPSKGGRKPRSGADEALALGFASGMTAEQAAAAAHVSAKTASRRLQDPAFQTRVNEIRREMFDRAAGLLSGGVGFAAARLRKLVQETTNESVLLGGIRSVFDYALRLHEHLTIEARVAALEALAKIPTKTGKGDGKK